MAETNGYRERLDSLALKRDLWAVGSAALFVAFPIIALAVTPANLMFIPLAAAIYSATRAFQAGHKKRVMEREIIAEADYVKEHHINISPELTSLSPAKPPIMAEAVSEMPPSPNHWQENVTQKQKLAATPEAAGGVPWR